MSDATAYFLAGFGAGCVFGPFIAVGLWLLIDWWHSKRDGQRWVKMK
jgi:hypothetical protein